MQTYYSMLIKPSWAPSVGVFGPVWAFLYTIIVITFVWVIVKASKGEVPRSVMAPFILNGAFNVLYTPLEFGLHNNFLASLDIILVLATLIWAMKAVWPRLKWVVWANLPYLLWVSFATLLQLTITYLNK